MGKSLNFTPAIAMTFMAAPLCIATIPPTPVRAETEVMRGSATAIDGRTLKLDGKTLKLAHITVPEPGDKCLMRGKVRDCGKFARLGLTELVVAATIECRKLTPHTYSCKTGDGYDLALGQVHAGWAVPAKSAPRHYFTKMKEVRARKRMLWSASHADGRPDYASALLDNN